MKMKHNDDKKNVNSFVQNYNGDLGSTMKNQQQTRISPTGQDIYGASLSQYYNGVQQQQQHQQQKQQSALKIEQFKYPSPSSTPISMYSPAAMEQNNYYNAYYNNSSWRYPNSTPTSSMSPSTFTYDPSQPPPPLPNLKKSDSPAPPPLPPLPPGEPQYFSSTGVGQLSIKTATSPDMQALPYPPPVGVDTSSMVCRPPPPLGRPVFRGGGIRPQLSSDNRGLKRNAPFAFKKSKPGFNKSQQPQLNIQKKHQLTINKLQNNLRASSAADGDDDGDDSLSHIQVNKKAKRKPMSTRYPRKIEWDRDDALKALALEKEYNKLQRNSMLILKFPDPELNKNIVKDYSPFIESVHFQQPSTPRYCFVQLKEGVDIEKVRKDICQIPFGVGNIVAERKRMHTEEDDTINPEDIDPYTLYIGNLPTTITVKTVKEHFPNSRRIDIGYAQRMRYTRYAFIRYETVEDAMEAYRNTFNLLIESRSLIVRFRRQKGNVGLPGESRPSNPKKDAVTNSQNKKQQNDEQTKRSENGEYEDEDICYVGGEVSKFEDIDSKENVMEEAQSLFRKDHGIKDEHTNWFNARIKDEPIDDDELMRQVDLYEESGYSDADNDEEEEDEEDWTYERKPDIKSLPIPFPIFNDNNKDKNVSEIIENPEENGKDKDKERHELDEIFDKINSEDDEFNF